MHYAEMHADIESNNCSALKRGNISLILTINSTIQCVTEGNNRDD